MIDTPQVRKLIRLAIEEDFAGGDLTTDNAISHSKRGRAEIVAKEDLRVCGVSIIAMIVEELGFTLKVKPLVVDGADLKAGKVIATLRGLLRELLIAERTMLNFIQHMCAISTNTRDIVKLAHKLSVCDTRKTTPGWRALEKYAVSVGGGKNHRSSLSDMILVKNNHIDACAQGVRGVLKAIFRNKPLYTPVEVEVRDLKELKAALEFPVDAIMLDNMDAAAIKSSMKILYTTDFHPLIEASGRMSAARFKELERLGVDAVSMSSLVHGRSSVDISMRISSGRV